MSKHTDDVPGFTTLGATKMIFFNTAFLSEPVDAAGTIGHVAHGKSTVVKAISGVQTVRFKNELERNITIKLGYANAKIYECTCDVRYQLSFASISAS